MAPDDNTGHSRSRGVSRRQFVKATGASGVALSVAGCTGNGGDGGDTTTTTGEGGGSNAGITVQFGADSNFKKVQPEINQILHDNGLAENIKLEVLAGSFTTGDRQTKYKQILNAKQSSPTILMMDNGWTIPFIARNQIANLSKEMPGSLVDKVMNDYFQASVSTATMDGDLYGIPSLPTSRRCSTGRTSSARRATPTRTSSPGRRTR
ncbi:twin-arginine translocation signal domain-containing protein [Haloarculaceae archaeon H-GB11]|nr:twin-arginine translocation signal domain-containing protein [Haloarculaceae archaeon H-GB11]